MDPGLPTVRDLFGGICPGPHSSLYTGWLLSSPTAHSTADGDSRHRLMGRLVPRPVDIFPPSGSGLGVSQGSAAKAGGQQNRGLQAGRAREPGGPRQREGSGGGQGLPSGRAFCFFWSLPSIIFCSILL